jgi:hypothetical protein
LHTRRPLEAAGIERPVAEAHAEALIQALSAEVATKADIVPLATKADLAELKYDLSWRVFGMVLGVVGVLNAILFAFLRGLH